MTKKSILVARAVFPEVLERLTQHFEVESNQADTIWPREEFIRRLQGKSGVFTTGGERIDADLLKACPDLKICANMAVGYNNFDVPAMTAAGVLATNAPDVLTETTADMGFALLMATARRVSESEAYLRAGQWTKWSYDMFTGTDIHGSTLGILGMGRIGRAIAKRGGHGFGMNVIYHNRSRLAPELEAQVNAKYVSKTDLFKQADHIVLVLPYSAENHHTVAAAEIALMKPTSTLINIGRGGLIDENALAVALQANKILGAGLDVFEGEPKVNPALTALKNVVLTPHIGSATVPTRQAMANLAADNLIAYLTQGQAKTPLNTL
ncbi:D-glycerate dehydrogenase [Variovorax sp. PCZ-1]|uniref:2-hydroxyacid dehydrogenase n=1 Tax=Variovorax sp. PCZ-1 TaxID=2835533 RepID=UPI001BD18D22|nr:D-glycerate dehydrogenase [Variovorax sp. PCZ-1]MBS7808295.1 D-glycerate dehydrogenase [Variovorax sp. PCZ-1]